MTVLAFLNQKGGTGKTTLSLNVAYGLAQAGERVLLIDADQQASANAWSSLREDQPFSVFAVPRKNLHKEVDRQRDIYDWIVIDGTPRDDAITRSCLIAADLVIIPIEPSRPVGLGIRPHRWTGRRGTHIPSRPARLFRHLPQKSPAPSWGARCGCSSCPFRRSKPK